MSHHGSPGFQSYTRTLRRLLWVEFIDAQMAAAELARSKASLLEQSQPRHPGPVPALDHRRLMPSASRID